MNIEGITQELKEISIEMDKLEFKQMKLMDKFYEVYPCLQSNTDTVLVRYYDIEYIVTDINFETQEVCLQTAPYEENNKIKIIDFITFDGVFNEWYEVVKY